MTIKPVGKAIVKDGKWVINIKSKGNLDRLADYYHKHIIHHEDNNEDRKQYFFIHEDVMYITDMNIHDLKKKTEETKTKEKPKTKPKSKLLHKVDPKEAEGT